MRIWPDYPEAHNNLAALLHIEGDLDAAKRHYEEAVRLRPDDPETHYNYALLLRATGDEANAEDHVRVRPCLAPEAPIFKSSIEPPT